MTVYLIHFNRPYKHARHYLGYAAELEKRLAQHRSGNGARLIEVVNAAGIEWECVRTWPLGRDFERKLKRQRNAPRLCPICNPDGWRNRGRVETQQESKDDSNLKP